MLVFRLVHVPWTDAPHSSLSVGRTQGIAGADGKSVIFGAVPCGFSSRAPLCVPAYRVQRRPTTSLTLHASVFSEVAILTGVRGFWKLLEPSTTFSERPVEVSAQRHSQE